MIRQDFNRNWTVKKVSVNLTESVLGGAKTPAEIAVTLPDDAMNREKRDAGSPAGGACGFYPGGDYEYSKRFHLEESEKGQNFFLEFEGIYNRGYIYVNGAQAGSTHYGYTGTFVDITPFLNYGADNLITVKVINSDVPNSRWYTGSGIFRPVSLYQGGSAYFDAADGLRISTPEISEEVAAVKVETLLRYEQNAEKSVTIVYEIIDANGTVVTSMDTNVTLYGRGKTPDVQRVYVRNPKLWSVGQPNLYRCRVTMKEADAVLDTVESTFGIRKLELNPFDGLKINNEKVLLRGGCIHHDNGPIGAATFARAEERRIELLKAAGFNSVRVAHNSSSKALLDACDRLGMLVMEESYDTWTQAKSQFDSSLVFSDSWEKDIEDIVRKDFNHPCVFMYSIGNEITDLHTSEGARWSRRLAAKVRKLDSTRYVTDAINSMTAVMGELPTVMSDLGLITQEQLQAMASGGGEGGDINDVMTNLLGQMNVLSSHPKVETLLNEAYEMLDLIGMNYMRGAYKSMAGKTNRIFYGSETLPPDIDLNWKWVKDCPACIGDYTWTAWDYIGEAGVGIVTYDDALMFKKPYPAYLAYCGDFDITGYRRPISYLREIVFGFRHTPYIAVQLPKHYGQKAMCTPWSLPMSVSSWTWNGFEGKPCMVEVYSDAPEVELFINGKSAGRLPAGEENQYRAISDTIYEPGEVKAVAHYSDGTLQEMVLCTAKEAVSLSVCADRTRIAADGLAYVDIELKDAHGVLHTAADCSVLVNVEGAGVLQALGSADPWSEENFFDRERTTYYGRAVAVIRAGAEAGTIKVTATAKGMDPVSVEIEVE